MNLLAPIAALDDGGRRYTCSKGIGKCWYRIAFADANIAADFCDDSDIPYLREIRSLPCLRLLWVALLPRCRLDFSSDSGLTSSPFILHDTLFAG